MNRVHPDDAERFQANRQQALDPANPEPYVHLEYRVRRRDGQVRWVEAYGVAYFAGTGHERRGRSFGGPVQGSNGQRGRGGKEALPMSEKKHRAQKNLRLVALD